MSRSERVAIVGIGAIFPRSANPDQFWDLVESGQAATREVPPGRWLLETADAHDPRVGQPDHVYSTRGCFVEDFQLDSEGLDLDPNLLGRLDPMFHLALHAGRAAWREARTDQVDRSRVGVVFGNLVLPTETASAIASSTLGRTFEEQLGFPDEPHEPIEPLNLRMAGLPAGLLAQALGLGGGAYTIDAACASSLYALKLASDELLSGRADAMLAGGLSRPDPLYTQMGFSQLRALSASGTASPFGAGADGLVVGEGSGIFVLKRLSDAVRHGDTIYGVITGAGLSNDVDGGLLAPHSEGQLRAMRSAYDRAGWSPMDVDLVECHATGTPVGDAVEFASLRTLWGESGWTPHQCVIGSVKSNVGHALTAAGAAGLLKVLLALKHGTLPPTAGFDQPAPGLELDQSPFRILSGSEPWPRRTPGLPRRAAISGFGFGGINAHILIEEWIPRDLELERTEPDDSPIAIIGLAAHVGPFAGLRAFQERVLGGSIAGEPTEPQSWWGAETSKWFEREGHASQPHRAYRIEQVELPTDRFRIPPRELEEMLPQQSLLLRLAAEAVDLAGWDDPTRLRAGCFVGLGLDPNSTNFHVRWSMLDKAREWNDRLGLGLSDEALDRWVLELRDSIGPALSANRTMGALGSIVASRVAREFRLGGPSFTVSAEEVSGLRALGLACSLLRRGELDQAIVGAVDFAGDLRTSIAEETLHPGTILSDGAAVVVLKRLEDAERDGDRIFAVIREVELTTGPAPRAEARSLPPVEEKVGHAGVASSLVSLVQATLSLDRQVWPAPGAPQFWLRDRVEGPRRIQVSASGIDGNHAVVNLEGHEPSSGLDTLDRLQPLGPMAAGLFAVEGDDPADLVQGLDQLEILARSSDQGIDALARHWWRSRPVGPARRLGLALVAEDSASLRGAIETARGRVGGARGRPGDGVAYSTEPLGPDSKLAFVFPGMGNHFEAMGRDLSACWAGVLRDQDQQSRMLASQMAEGCYWNAEVPDQYDDHRSSIFGQVSFGTFAADLLKQAGVAPDASIGYSLGETTALFALRAWTDRDEMFRRFDASPLFRSDLAGPCDAARATWNLETNEPVDWVAGILQRPAEVVLQALQVIPRAYLLIINTDDQVVVGGQGPAIRRLVETVGGAFHPLPLVSTVHSEIVHKVEQAYHDLHLLPTTPPPGVRYYSGASGQAFDLDRESAADSILAHALHGVDFPAMVRGAYADGVRAFVEVGPGGSCTRMIGEILGGQPHLALAACPATGDPLGSFFGVLARLIADRYPVDLAAIYGRDVPTASKNEPNARTILVAVGVGPFSPPEIPPALQNEPNFRGPDPVPHFIRSSLPETNYNAVLRQSFATESARGSAHEAYLRTASGLERAIAGQIEFQLGLIHQLAIGGDLRFVPRKFETPSVGLLEPEAEPLALDRDQCLEFAVGRIGEVLGPDFAAIDAHPTRVRLPDEPLMLVDRILTIEGEPRSMTTGRVVTEHDVLAGAWYLDADRIPTCIAVESGQADLFLSAYLGIDFETKGLAVYRLLDAVVTFYRELPGPGQVIRYDIAIDGFFRQGESRLFRFRFEATVDGEPLMSMRDGCAGFFTAEALAAGQGIVKTALDRRAIAGIKPPDWSPLVAMTAQSMTDDQVEALREGDLARAFGPQFAGLNLLDPIRLPGGLMRLVDRVLAIEPEGGRFGLGLIRAEADIRPEDWYMTCHFVDDRVMPGTLMYECCLHTLRIFLMRMGWVGEAGEVACQPVPGVSSKLKCRGQVIESTRTVTYEVSVKELGYRPEPYAIVDALMFADGRPIVEITDMSLRMTGLDRETLERIWLKADRSVLYDTAKILAFAVGNPSEAFGEPYRIFDQGRIIARLPGPPYQFLDRVVEVGGDPWKMVAGARAVAEYDVPPDAWYFEADRQDRMPFAVLLEAALQPCGWLAAYVGSALTSEVDLSFRNLGGSAVQVAPVDREIGTLTTSATLTKVSRSGGMIIQQYDFVMMAGDRPIYRGETTFGFFSKQALSNQVGIRDAALWSEPGSEPFESFGFPRTSPFPDARWGMIDRVEEYHPEGGPHHLGFVLGTKRVNPSEWFFAAHFHQDPVVPGSLGLESFQQLLKVVAEKRWGAAPGARFESMGLDDVHRWTYRGQILPTDNLVTVRVVVTAIDDARRWIKADGFLDVDGRVIYQMNDFTLRLDGPR